VKFAKLGPMRLTSHLDVTRAVQRGMRRAGVAVAYSQGFSPHPRIAFGPPLPLGETGEGEYFDVLLSEAPGEGWLERLNRCLPHGLEVLEASLVEKSAPSLMASVNAAAYSVRLWSENAALLASQARTLEEALEASGNLIDFEAGEVENGKLEATVTVKLKGKGVRPDKVLSEHLATGALGLKVNRKALFVDRAGTLYSPLTGFRARIT
jgi:radical SAM-linked protein